MVIPGSKKHFCEKLMKVGTWEGTGSLDEKTSGPIVQCVECGKRFSLSWDRWERVPIENKLEQIRQRRAQ